MEDVSSFIDFRHEPLPDSASYLRLLEILQCDFERQVVCRMTTWPIQNAPPYIALSYTWGDPVLLAHITINERDMIVRKNCAYALQQAFASKTSKYFWLDAICINQASTEEKNCQVAIMGDLYRKATHVLACVGPHEHDSKFLLEMFVKKHSLLADIHSHITDFSMGGWSVSNPIPTKRWLALRCFFDMPPAVRKRLAEALIAFMIRPYFSRVWVLQELHLASRISFCCGMDVRSFDYLLAISMLVDFWINEQAYANQWGYVTRKVVSFLSSLPSWILRRQKICKSMHVDFLGIRPQRGCLALASGARGPRRLAEVMDAMQYFHCTDIRDKLYGVLSLVDWHNSSAPEPDYGKDRFEVAVEVLGKYLVEDTCAPTSGAVVEWARRLGNVFEISLDQAAMQKALEIRCYESKLPRTISTHRTGSVIESTLHFAPNASIAISDRQLPNRRRNHQNTENDWRGVHIGKSHGFTLTSNRHPWLIQDVYCSTNHVDPCCTRIDDLKGRPLAYAPRDAKAEDWLLINNKSSLAEKNALAIIVRASRSLRFIIIGQVYISAKHSVKLFSLPNAELFKLTWHPEDLLLLDWSYVSRAMHQLSQDKIADWLNLKICVTKDSSYAERLPERQLSRGLYPRIA